jgi:hypothetical protein
MTALVMLQMLFQFEGLSTARMLAFKNPVWQLIHHIKTYSLT